ncbi:MAG: hypothetical protein ACJ74Y_10660, partial [Bryobacteraceae bacterium]
RDLRVSRRPILTTSELEIRTSEFGFSVDMPLRLWNRKKPELKEIRRKPDSPEAVRLQAATR